MQVDLLPCNHRMRRAGRASAAFASALAACACRAAEGQPSDAPSHLVELFWGLLLLLSLSVAGLVWVSVVRRQVRQQTGDILRREAALEAWYRDLFDNAHDIILGMDFDGRLLSLNRAGEAVLGIPRERCRDFLVAERVIARDRSGFAALLASLQAADARAHGEVEIALAGDRRVVLRMNLRRQELPGQSAHIQGVAWDVTERRRAEEALRESEQRLRHSVEERVRIGRDLHDGIIQSIYAVGLSLRECQSLVREDPAAAAERLRRSVADLNAVIREVRAFIEGLEPEALKGSEFRTALESIAEGLTAATPLEPALAIDPQAANLLTAQQAAELLQIAREALSNAIRHGRPTTLEVALRAEADQVALEIRDDGCGFTPGSVDGAGLGLRNIEGRTRDLGGHATIDSAPGRGTRICVHIPAAPSL